MDKKMKIVVVCGGFSSEREVSLNSGKAVYNALINNNFTNVELFDLTKDNLAQLIDKKPELVYIALHGEGGEDGCLQGALELAGIPYTGPGVETSAVCMNKVLTKQIMNAYDIPTAKFLVFNKHKKLSASSIADSIKTNIGIPVVLKSPCQGSSVGVIIVKDENKLIEAIEEIYTYGDVLLAEEFLSGIEITLPIFGNDELTVLPDVEITTGNEFYDYEAKYTAGKCNHIIPSSLTEEEKEVVANIGAELYRVLGCKGLSRIDFIVDKNKGPMVIEVNTSPGMTEMSLFPDSAKYAAISFEELILKVAELGFEN